VCIQFVYAYLTEMTDSFQRLCDEKIAETKHSLGLESVVCIFFSYLNLFNYFRPQSGFTPVMFASLFGHKDVVRQLTRGGCDLELTCDVRYLQSFRTAN